MATHGLIVARGDSDSNSNSVDKVIAINLISMKDNYAAMAAEVYDDSHMTAVELPTYRSFSANNDVDRGDVIVSMILRVP